MGYGIVEISFPLVFGKDGIGLPFPDNTRYITVEQGQWDRTFKLVLSHPDLPDGPTPTPICPIFRREGDDVAMKDWGILDREEL